MMRNGDRFQLGPVLFVDQGLESKRDGVVWMEDVEESSARRELKMRQKNSEVVGFVCG